MMRRGPSHGCATWGRRLPSDINLEWRHCPAVGTQAVPCVPPTFHAPAGIGAGPRCSVGNDGGRVLRLVEEALDAVAQSVEQRID